MNRKLKTKLPSAEHLLPSAGQRGPPRENRSKRAYDKSAQPLCPLERDDLVRVRGEGRWGPVAQVLKETTPRSYEVLTEHGSRIRRNRRHLLKIPRTESHDPENGDAVEVQSEQLGEQGEQGNDLTDTESSPVDSPSSGVERVERPRRSIVKPKRLVEEC
ncbi:hypothetical protein AAFF_G00336420 [Aldrovandia affinis]|uniref:Uncharacterized protein n=1 Tax=Aldrovandia affinis TaxID=143900 RepID=A0AAD7W0D7_9TELE|nr:hypothetical protein AAFF_G00336420 [Aldrovandia affinis]